MEFSPHKIFSILHHFVITGISGTSQRRPERRTIEQTDAVTLFAPLALPFVVTESQIPEILYILITINQWQRDSSTTPITAKARRADGLVLMRSTLTDSPRSLNMNLIGDYLEELRATHRKDE
jgi:hypothetical protein